MGALRFHGVLFWATTRPDYQPLFGKDACVPFPNSLLRKKRRPDSRKRRKWSLGNYQHCRKKTSQTGKTKCTNRVESTTFSTHPQSPDALYFLSLAQIDFRYDESTARETIRVDSIESSRIDNIFIPPSKPR